VTFHKRYLGLTQPLIKPNWQYIGTNALGMFTASSCMPHSVWNGGLDKAARSRYYNVPYELRGNAVSIKRRSHLKRSHVTFTTAQSGNKTRPRSMQGSNVCLSIIAFMSADDRLSSMCGSLYSKECCSFLQWPSSLITSYKFA
jgi:hypothetical protein